MDFNEQELKHRLAGKRIGGTLRFFAELDSTNETAFALAVQGAPEGTVVVADAQRGGKGRLKRRWLSPPGCNLYTSIILRPAVAAAVAPQLTLVAGVALAEFLSPYCPGYVRLKWPNDVLIRGAKVGGILTEMKSAGRGVDFVILGIGVNINMGKEDLDAGLRQSATSLKAELGREVSRLEVAAGVCGALEGLYGLFLKEGFPPVRERWLRHAAWLGKDVRVLFGSEVLEGEMVGLDTDGALRVRNGVGTVTRIIAGDASLREG